MSLSLPADLEKDGATRTASTASEYWDLRWKGFAPVPQDEEPTEEASEPAPQQQDALAARRANPRSQKKHVEPEGNATGDES